MGLFDFLGGLFGGGGGDADDADSRPETGGGESTDEDVKDVTEFGPAEFRTEAEEFADDHEDQAFDFTVDSLERLDQYASRQTEVLDVLGEEMDGGGDLLGSVAEGYILWFGSYFGEVLVREFDGEWVTDGEGAHVAVPAGDDTVEIPVLNAAAAAVTDEPRFAETADSLRERIEAGAAAEEAVGAAGASTDVVGFDETDAAEETPTERPTRPSVDLESGMDLDAAHERAVQTYEDAGFHVSSGDLMNSVGGPTEGIAKLFNFYTDESMHTAVVYPGEWDDEATNAVLTLASRLRTDMSLDGFHVVAANDPPAGLAYLTGTHPRGAFALAAMSEVQNGPAFGPESAGHYADVGQELLATYFDVEVDIDDVESLAAIDTVVLEQLRTVGDHERDQDGYRPEEALLTVGTLAGEIMRAAFEREFAVETEWDADGTVSSTGVVLQVTPVDGDESVTVNPVGKAFKLFENGSADSIEFMYEATRDVVADDLGSASSL